VVATLTTTGSVCWTSAEL